MSEVGHEASLISPTRHGDGRSDGLEPDVICK